MVLPILDNHTVMLILPTAISGNTSSQISILHSTDEHFNIIS